MSWRQALAQEEGETLVVGWTQTDGLNEVNDGGDWRGRVHECVAWCLFNAMARMRRALAHSSPCFHLPVFTASRQVCFRSETRVGRTPHGQGIHVVMYKEGQERHVYDTDSS